MQNTPPGLSNAVKREYAAKVTLSLVFFGALIAVYFITGAGRLEQAIKSWSALDFILLAAATYRLGHLVAYDRVMEPHRHPFARTVPDGSGAGESVEAIGEGIRHTIGQLITCPICAGTWIAAGLVYGLVWLPALTRLFLWMTAAIGLAEIVNSFTEVGCWSGQYFRVLVGEVNRRRKAEQQPAESLRPPVEG